MPRLQLVPDIARLRLLCFLALLGGKPSRENMEDSDALAGASGAETAEEGQRGQLGEEEDVLAGAFRNFGTFFRWDEHRNFSSDSTSILSHTRSASSSPSGGGLWRAAARAQEAVQEVTASFQRTNWAQEIREFQSGIFAEAAEDARALRWALTLSWRASEAPTLRRAAPGPDVSPAHLSCPRSEVVQSQHLQERSREALRAARERSAQLAAQLEAANPELSGALRGAGQSLARFAGSIVERSRKFAEAVVQEALLVTPGPTGRAGAGDSMQTRGDVCAVQRDSRCAARERDGSPNSPERRVSRAQQCTRVQRCAHVTFGPQHVFGGPAAPGLRRLARPVRRGVPRCGDRGAAGGGCVHEGPPLSLGAGRGVQ